MRTLSLKLHEDLLTRLETEARVRGMTRSALARQILERNLGGDSPLSTASCYDLAHDLAGSIKGLPKDLAHHPKYMAGFGS